MKGVLKITKKILFITLLLINNLSPQIPTSLKLLLSQKIHDSPVFSTAVYNDSLLFSTSLKNEIKILFPQTGASREISASEILPKDPTETEYKQFIPSVSIIKNNLIVAWKKKLTSTTLKTSLKSIPKPQLHPLYFLRPFLNMNPTEQLNISTTLDLKIQMHPQQNPL